MLKNLQEELAKQIFGISKSETVEKGICINCKQEALPNCYSEAGRREFKISGFCEKCFNKITEDKEYPEYYVCEYCGKEIKENEEAYLVEHHTYCSATCYGHDVGF